MDQEDQLRLIKNICKAENIDVKKISPKYILAIIDKWKNKGYYPQDVILKKKDVLEKSFLNIYKIYQQKLIDLNAADFSDLILHTVKIFKNYKDILAIYSKKFKYILVDEYQDTNFIQSEWLKFLSTTNKSSIVASINELFTSVNVDSDGKNAHLDTVGVMESLENLDSAVGNLAFGTTFPASVVDLTTAVNNVRADLSLLDSDNTSLEGRLGTLANLDSAFIGTERTSMVNALNALRADIALIFDENGTQLN